jgi:hypothetical protein
LGALSLFDAKRQGGRASGEAPGVVEVAEDFRKMMDGLTFEEFATFIREYRSIPARTQIRSETQFERDLGLTGDDGIDLIKATEKRFEVTLGNGDTGVRETFNLQPNEYLFNSEGWGPSRAEIISLFSGPRTVVRKFTVGELFEAVRKAKAKNGGSHR